MYYYQPQLKHFDQWFRFNEVDRLISLPDPGRDIWYHNRPSIGAGERAQAEKSYPWMESRGPVMAWRVYWYQLSVVWVQRS